MTRCEYRRPGPANSFFLPLLYARLTVDFHLLRQHPQGAPFRCAVDHGAIAYNLNEFDFQASPRKYMAEAIADLSKNNFMLLQKKWMAQREAAPDLLWHVPHSRVTQNILEDVYRKCLTNLRGNNDAA